MGIILSAGDSEIIHYHFFSVIWDMRDEAVIVMRKSK